MLTTILEITGAAAVLLVLAKDVPSLLDHLEHVRHGGNLASCACGHRAGHHDRLGCWECLCGRYEPSGAA